MHLPNVYQHEAAAAAELHFATKVLRRKAEGAELSVVEKEKLTAALARLSTLRGDQAAELIGRVGRYLSWV